MLEQATKERLDRIQGKFRTLVGMLEQIYSLHSVNRFQKFRTLVGMLELALTLKVLSEHVRFRTLVGMLEPLQFREGLHQYYGFEPS